MDEWVGGWKDEWMDGWVHGWVISCSAHLSEPETNLKGVLKEVVLEGHSEHGDKAGTPCTFLEEFFIGSLNR